MTRVMVCGAASLVGAEVLRTLLARDGVEVFVGDRRGVDRLHGYLGVAPSAISDEPFDVVINCDAPGEARSLQDGAPHPPLCGTFSPHAGRRISIVDRLERDPNLRLVHLSTAFVGGRRRGLFTEFDFDLGQRFHNAWERTHFETEKRLRASAASERIAIVRASHTLGRAATGDAFDLGGAYPLLSALASAPLLPGDPRARIDFVPADYVAAAMVELALSGAAGTFHLAGGWDASIPVRHAAALAAHAHGRRRGVLLLPRIVAWPLRGPARDYLYQGPVFDTFLAERALGVRCPPAEEWLPTIMRVAEERAWKAPRAFEEAVEAAAEA